MQGRHRKFHCIYYIITSTREWFGNNLQCSVEIIISWHHESATHYIKFVPAHRRCAVCGVGAGAHAQAELIIILSAEMSTKYWYVQGAVRIGYARCITDIIDTAVSIWNIATGTKLNHHPLCKRLVTSGDVWGDIASDRISCTSSAVGIQLSTISL